MAYLASDLERLAIVMQVAIIDGDDLVHGRYLTDEIEHRALADLGRGAQRQAGDGTQMVLELAALGAFRGPVTRVVNARGDLVSLQTAIDFKELEGQHANVLQLLENTTRVILSQCLQRVIGAGDGKAQDAAVVRVVHQRVETGLTVAGTHRDQRDFAAEGYEAFEQARHAPQLSEGIDHVIWLAQDLLALAVVTQGAGCQHRRQTDAGNGGVQVRLGLDVGESRRRDAQILEHALLEPAIASNAQGFSARVDRHELRQKGDRLGRHAFKLKGHQIDFIGQLAQMILVAIVGTQMLTQRGSASVRRRVQKREVHSQRSTRQCQHATQLAATDYADLHENLRPRAGLDYPERCLSAPYGIASVQCEIADVWRPGCWPTAKRH